QMREFLADAVEAALVVGKDAVNAGRRGVELLMAITRDHAGDRRLRQAAVTDPFEGAQVRQVEMQPQPAVVTVVDRLVRRQRTGAAVLVDAKAPQQAGNQARRQTRADGDGWTLNRFRCQFGHRASLHQWLRVRAKSIKKNHQSSWRWTSC